MTSSRKSFTVLLGTAKLMLTAAPLVVRQSQASAPKLLLQDAIRPDQVGGEVGSDRASTLRIPEI